MLGYVRARYNPSASFESPSEEVVAVEKSTDALPFVNTNAERWTELQSLHEHFRLRDALVNELN